MLDLLASRGLIDLKMHPLTFGIATLYVGTKPERATSTAGGSTLVMNQDGLEQTPIHGPPDLVLAMTGASGAPYAVRLLQTLCGLGRTIHLAISPSAVQVLREETGLKAVDRTL